VQCPGTFIELLAVTEPDRLGADGMSELFGRYNQDYLAHSEGLSLLILESKDAKADADDFKRAGISAAEAVHFEREAKRPDGTPIKVGFSLAFAQDRAAPSMRFATCQQHYPENFWNPAFQKHPNGASEVRSVIMVADDPERHREFASAYTGSTDFYIEPGEVSLWLSRGSLSIMTPARFQAAFGGPQPVPGNHLQAIRFAVADIAAARALMQKNGVKPRDQRERQRVAKLDLSDGNGGVGLVCHAGRTMTARCVSVNSRVNAAILLARSLAWRPWRQQGRPQSLRDDRGVLLRSFASAHGLPRYRRQQNG
jgi:hypothetical protein